MTAHMQLRAAVLAVRKAARENYGNERFFNETKMLAHLKRLGYSERVACDAIITVQCGGFYLPK